ncbi:aggregation factor core [Aliishimia ponticola]|uniref:Aggregation factor core n=1 Tax=Aliishimia ponticola TaxID=2499833 RepID=A0A4S4NLJ9_9RHOB|nr:aggregation factor core [Aliishimia ponticola]THH37050.1 aggregation factor core [Aliishimia ponticola]
MRFTLAGLALSASPAFADLDVAFIEGAPKDRFELTFNSACPLGSMPVTVDLAGSAGALIFDTTGQGAGVEVYQPFELVEGAERVAESPRVSDGDRKITLNIASIAPGQVIAFTIDVDDTISNRQITVSGSEIAGARVIADGNSAAFGADARAKVQLPDCMG